MPINIDFFKSPDEVVKFLKQKYPELHFDYDEIMHYAHNRAFTIAKITKLDLLRDIQKSLTEAYKNGAAFEEWKKNILPTLAKHGWLGNVEVTNPKTGEVKKIYVGNRRLKTIYSTNMKVAYSHSRYKSQMQSHGEYFRYIAVLDNKTRPTHASHHGLILPKDDPFWDTHYPPNAWNCRCKVRVYTKKQLERKGWKVAHTPPPFAHKDWAYHVGKTDNNARLLKIYKDKANKIDDIALKNLANKSAYKIADELAKRLRVYKAIADLFTSRIKKKLQLDTTDMFGKHKPLYLSDETVKEHIDKHEDVTPFEYSLIPQMLKGKKDVFKDGDRVYIILKKIGRYYRLAIKNINGKDEVFVTSLANLGRNANSYEREKRKLRKKFEELKNKEK